jgi:hypothetical protein
VAQWADVAKEPGALNTAVGSTNSEVAITNQAVK